MRRHGVHMVGSLFQDSGHNTAVIFAPSGEIVGACRKQHIPGTDGYSERLYFRSGGPEQDYPVFELQLPCGPCRVAVPTCYDQAGAPKRP